ncbi:MAG: hypothetical protein AAF841_01045 [Pseudomonadota bacterium]
MEPLDQNGVIGGFEALTQEEQNKKLADEFASYFIESELIDIVLEDDEE